jgi:hypothetical protein
MVALKLTPKEKAEKKWKRLVEKINDPNNTTSYDRQKAKLLAGTNHSYDDTQDFKRI